MLEMIQPYMWMIYIGLALLALVIIGSLLSRVLGGSVRGRRGSRLGISEYYEIDKSRRLVIIRRDGVEHLVMIGGPQDLVIEGNIGSGMVSNQDGGTTQPPQRPAPRPATFAPRRPMLKPVREEPEM